MERLQQSHQLQANKKRREPDFDVRNKIWLLINNIRINRPNHKFNHQQLGPYNIIEKRKYSYLLKLPETFKGKY
jgi:hypothetical protein